MTDWKPIKSAPEFKFDAENWYMSGPSLLVWNGKWAEIAKYGYTKKGKGRWQGVHGIVNPTHWMPLPPPPKE